ncbi:MAG: 50S ribosomal protein L10 [Candidatus Ancillula trichonymphae]|jgi:large subunit ribosomal protein L10|nr:50S ribosomal protein L10 [Candidatus Ancillula trichonymphae]
MATERKIQQVAELKQLFEVSDAVVLTRYHGLTVAQIKDLRTKLGTDVRYVVAKNTLVKIAAKAAGVEVLDESLLSGSTAIAFVTGDVVACAKTLRDFAKDFEVLEAKGGVYEGGAITAEDIKKIASLESREVLLAKVTGSVKAGIAKAAYVLQAPASKTVRTVEALRAKKET